ncbi:AAA family ATPase [Streptomyces cyaneofuscatus]|uniref:AAA family ATPase n=1 Tax=Streptomyces cyaneofuscatus TaxID=66883 RepID=UPI003655DD40
MTTLFLMVGLPGAGKTTRARQLAEEHGALRLAPDEWMLPLFGEALSEHARDLHFTGRRYQKAKTELVASGCLHEKRETVAGGVRPLVLRGIL